MRLVDVPVRVSMSAETRRFVSFHWRGRTYKVARIVDRWRYVGRWWIGEGEWRFIKVETIDGGLFELYFDTAADEWRLYRVYD